MAILGYSDQINELKKIGECLRGGDFLESPFDYPVEEHRRGDPDQRDDNLNFPKKERQYIVINMEPGLADAKKRLHDIAYEPRFKYFLDGTLKTKYLGEYLEGNNNFPILSSEISCAVTEKVGSKLRPGRLEKRLAFIFPHKDSGLISDTKYDKLVRINQLWIDSGNYMRIEFLQKKTDEMDNIRYSMLGKARDLMHKLESEVAQQLDTDDDWLIIDGAIRKSLFLKLKNTIGLAKSFSRNPIFDLGDGDPLMITSYLSRIKEGERTAVFRKETETEGFIFWYVKLRDFPPMEPLGGIVKIDFSYEGNELSEDTLSIIDEISAEVYSMRFPSLYPEPRWPSYIYPIRLAERIMQSSYLNSEIIGIFGRELRKTIHGV